MSLIADDFDTDTENEIRSFENEVTEEMDLPIGEVYLRLLRAQQEREAG